MRRWLSFFFLVLLATSAFAYAPAPKLVLPQTGLSWFTNTAAFETTTNYYNSAGMVRRRIWQKADGTTNRTQILYWDSKERLSNVLEYDAAQNGYYWSAEYDGLDRRLFTTTYVMTNGVVQAYGVTPTTINSFFDSLGEFLELGASVNGKATWKMYGPDLSGSYGGMNGVGGLDAVVTDLAAFIPTVADARGNILGAVTNGIVSWSPARPTGYGAVAGYRPAPFGHGGDIVTASAWRGVWSDVTGLYWRGKRYYDPSAGHWLSDDPAWNGRDPNYYSYCGGDPINFDDPHGMFALQTVDYAYNGGLGGQALRSLGGYLENYQTDNPLMAMLTGGAGSLAETFGGMVTPASYVDSASHFGTTVNTLYKEDGLGVAASYAATSWNVGAVWSGAANINLATGEAVGDWYERGTLMSSGVAGTAGVASGGLGLYNWATAVPKPPVVVPETTPVPASYFTKTRIEAEALMKQGLNRSEAFEQIRSFNAGNADGFLFHFTDEIGGRGIVQSGEVFATQRGLGGPGVYTGTTPTPNFFQQYASPIGWGLNPGSSVRIPIMLTPEIGAITRTPLLPRWTQVIGEGQNVPLPRKAP